MSLEAAVSTDQLLGCLWLSMMVLAFLLGRFRAPFWVRWLVGLGLTVLGVVLLRLHAGKFTVIDVTMAVVLAPMSALSYGIFEEYVGATNTAPASALSVPAQGGLAVVALLIVWFGLVAFLPS